MEVKQRIYTCTLKFFGFPQNKINSQRYDSFIIFKSFFFFFLAHQGPVKPEDSCSFIPWKSVSIVTNVICFFNVFFSLHVQEFSVFSNLIFFNNFWLCFYSNNIVVLFLCFFCCSFYIILSCYQFDFLPYLLCSF